MGVAVYTSACIHLIKQSIHSVSHVAAIFMGAGLRRSTSHKLTASSAEYQMQRWSVLRGVIVQGSYSMYAGTLVGTAMIFPERYAAPGWCELSDIWQRF